MIYFEFIKPIPWTIRRITKQYFEVLDDLSPVLHPMVVWVVPYPSFFAHDGDECLGQFLWSNRDKNVVIILAGKQPIEEYVDTLCHEIAHYEQYRDGKEIQEAGVRVRARTLNQLVQNELNLAI